MSEMTVDTDDLRDAATTAWEPWSEDVRAMAAAARAAGAPLTAQDWSLVPGAQEVRAEFVLFLEKVAGSLDQGAETLESIARNLLLSAQDYLEAEEGNEAELAEVQAELEAIG